MTKQQTTEAPEHVFQAEQTNARITVTGNRWECSGCGKGRTESNTVEFARLHAKHCAVLPLP
ncbi:MAG TPA: hypothetical protein VIU15_41560 [Streptomyces sp.]